ncbi:MAG: NUDIX hydrolase [Candidatus Poribacteria bacterium]|nr:NUDIX hydrolase [Candidatus Poribacteria bacterium]
MSHINAQIEELERRYGVPALRTTHWGTEGWEFDLLKRACDKDRCHDVTTFILRGDRIAVIRKPDYPPDVYRPPSGGVEPGERFEDGATREAYEETGLTVEIRDYLLRADVTFHHPSQSFRQSDETIRWVTHVFLADWRCGEPRPIDTKEIAQARWATLDELRHTLQSRLDHAPTRGLRYRGWLQREALFALAQR